MNFSIFALDLNQDFQYFCIKLNPYLTQDQFYPLEDYSGRDIKFTGRCLVLAVKFLIISIAKSYLKFLWVD